MRITHTFQLCVAFVASVILTACGGAARFEPAAAPPADSTPQLLMVDGPHVARVRESLRRGEPQFVSALTTLEENADRALKIAPMSVMGKGVTPPSGDKHDYMSQAPYWWPDPSKPDGLPYIVRDGERNPEVDRITDHENLIRLSSAVSSLGLAFYFTGHEEYAQQAARLVRVWFLDPDTRMTPRLEFAQGIPGIAKGRSAGIIESRFLPSIIDGVMLLQGSPAWTAADDEAFKSWMDAYLQWLITSPLGQEEADRGNNQETWYDLQVVALALYTRETDAAQRTLQAARTAIGVQFETDGRQPRELRRTRAWDYSIFNLNAFMHVAALGDRLGVDLWNYRTADGRTLRQGVEYLVPFATGEKRFPYQQITEFHPSALHPILRWAALGWNEPRYRDLARQIGGGTATLDLTVP
jgi:Alginate lyase